MERVVQKIAEAHPLPTAGESEKQVPHRRFAPVRNDMRDAVNRKSKSPPKPKPGLDGGILALKKTGSSPSLRGGSE
jgi:hypothetical protein